MFDNIVAFAECANLYNCPKNGASEVVTKTFVDSTASGVSFNFYDFISHFNYFALAWTMFYSFVLMTNFYYWRVISHRERLHHEAKGVKSIQDIVKFWWRYIITLFIFTLISIYRDNFGITSVLLIIYFLFYFRKFYFDLFNLMESVGESFDQISWKENWPKDLSKKMKNASVVNFFSQKEQKK